MVNSRVLITGAAGRIGTVLREALCGQYSLVRCADVIAQPAARESEEVVHFDLREPESIARAMQGIDCVVHLAGIPEEGPWEIVQALNIEGCYRVFEAARLAQVKRMIFASSNHAVGFHRRSRIIDENCLPRPDTRYGVSKVFGEALGRLYADKHGMSVASLRIGTFRTPDRPSEPRQLLTWISHRDTVQLVRCCIEHPGFHYLNVYGVSNNTRSRWRNNNAAFLGYQPQDDSERFAEEILSSASAEDHVAAQFHGGFFCPMEFDGDTDRID
jgi:uronate dehydrogenase